MRTLTNLTPENYLKVLATTACAVGNSSSFVRDAGYFGTPVVLVGNRQNGRETDVARRARAGRDGCDRGGGQEATGARPLCPASTLYGDGDVSERIAAGDRPADPLPAKTTGLHARRMTPAAALPSRHADPNLDRRTVGFSAPQRCGC